MGLTCDPANGGCIQCTSDAQCNDSSGCTADSCDLSTHKCVNKSLCDATKPYCCGAACGACCYDSDCQGGITTAAAPIGKCPVSYCNTTTYTCGTKFVVCPIQTQ
jgi:hypothetical protein